jgi:hypothetical protein
VFANANVNNAAATIWRAVETVPKVVLVWLLLITPSCGKDAPPSLQCPVGIAEKG